MSLRLKTGLACFAAVVLVVGGLTALIVHVHHNEARDSRAQTHLMYRANHVCDKSGGTLSIDPHDSTWSFGPWLEVTCNNNTVRAIR